MRTTLVSLVALAAAATVFAQAERGKAEATIGGKRIAVDYGRPALKGRDMLAQAPPGTVWRTGMNEATTIETEADLVFGSVRIAKGSYSLWTRRVDEKSWELVFNSQTGQWGTQHDPSKDVASVPLEWTQKDDSTEVFTIEIEPRGENGGTLRLVWGTHVLSASFTIG